MEGNHENLSWLWTVLSNPPSKFGGTLTKCNIVCYVYVFKISG